jgi:hypothetical protein
MSGRVRRLLVGSFLSVVMLGASALVFVAAPAHGALALNHAMLDDGTCGQVLQLGSNITASRSSTPSFLLAGDGALSSYAMAIDGVSIGTFYSNQYSQVCVRDTIVLRDGAHQLTGKELKPNAANVVTAFSFTVDTVAPPAPYGLRLDAASDTGVIGDNVTTSTNLRIDGFGTPGAPIHVLEGSLLRAGTMASSTGAWSATTTSLPSGTHTFTAVALDSAGNQSLRSTALSVTIGTTAPTTSTTTTPAPTTTTTKPATTTTSTTTPATTSTTKPATTTTTTRPTTTTTTALAGSVPSAPSASASGQTPRGVRLQWSTPYNGGWPINYYLIYRSSISGREVLYAAVLPTNSYSDLSTIRGVTYYYRVAAHNARGVGALSAEVYAQAR